MIYRPLPIARSVANTKASALEVHEANRANLKHPENIGPITDLRHETRRDLAAVNALFIMIELNGIELKSLASE